MLRPLFFIFRMKNGKFCEEINFILFWVQYDKIRLPNEG